MNKKTFVYWIIGLFATCLFSIPAFASQEIDDYFFQYEQYRKTYDEFKIDRDKYLTYQTLESQIQAISSARKLIIQRSNTLRAYFLALKLRLRTAPGLVNIAYKESLISSLDKEIIWLESQNSQLEVLTTPSLNDLFIISDRVESREETFDLLTYRSLSLVLLGKARVLQSESVSLTNLLSDEIDKLEATKAAQFRNWQPGLENKNYLSQKEIEKAESYQDELKKEKDKAPLMSLYSSIQNGLKKVKEYLSQALVLQQEIYDSLKND